MGYSALGNRVESMTADSMAAEISKFRETETIVLSFNSFDSLPIDNFIKTLEFLENLKALEFRCYHLHLVSCADLEKIFKAMTHVEALDLHNNDLGSIPDDDLVKMFRILINLERLDLRHSGFNTKTDQELITLFDKAFLGSKITSLILDECIKARPEVMRAVNSILESNRNKIIANEDCALLKIMFACVENNRDSFFAPKKLREELQVVAPKSNAPQLVP